MRDGLPECGACHTRFVLNELQVIADSPDPCARREAAGPRRAERPPPIKSLDIRITESEVARKEDVDAKLVSWHSRCGPSC